MTPSFGARFELLRRHVDRQGALYDVTIFLPQGRERYTLQIASADGHCQLRPEATAELAGGLPDWVQRHLLALARGVFRAAQRQSQGDELCESLWQRRLLRWHEEPQLTEARGQRVRGAASPASADESA